MSEWHPVIVRIGKVGKNPNADNLSITTVFGYPVQFSGEAFKAGDLAGYVPIDSVVSTSVPAFAWLAPEATSEGKFRVRAIKLRNVPSYGFLVPLSELDGQIQRTATGGDMTGCGGEWKEGDRIDQWLQIEKYDPGPCYQLGGEVAGDFFTAPADNLVPHYDIEGLRRYPKLFTEGEQVLITEKIHGSNGRWLYHQGELYCGSRTKWRKNSIWNRMADKYGLAEKLRSTPGEVLFGEVFGPGIQDLQYGLAEAEVRFFDLYNTKNGRYLDPGAFAQAMENLDLPAAPILYSGPFNYEAAIAMAEGMSIIDPTQIREGIVVKPVEERWDQEIGRVFLKLPGEGYLLRKDKPK